MATCWAKTSVGIRPPDRTPCTWPAKEPTRCAVLSPTHHRAFVGAMPDRARVPASLYACHPRPRNGYADGVGAVGGGLDAGPVADIADGDAGGVRVLHGAGREAGTRFGLAALL